MNAYSLLVLRRIWASSAIATHTPQWLALKMVSTVLSTTRLTRTTLAFRTTELVIRVCPLHVEVSAALTVADIATHAPQTRPPRFVAIHAEVLAATATMVPQARRPMLVEAHPSGSMPAPTTTMMVAALGRKGISPLKKLSVHAE